jgi:hypothetical protein
MGLGKSCSMIALIARDLESHAHSNATRVHSDAEVPDAVQATLLVVPLSRESSLLHSVLR